MRIFGPIPNLPTDIYLLIPEDMKTTPRVRAFFDFVTGELAAIRKILDTSFAKTKRPPHKGRPLKSKSVRAKT